MVESMADTRELTMDDYLAMVRRRLKVVIVPILIAPIAGFLVSYGFSPGYNPRRRFWSKAQKVPSRLRALGGHDRLHAARENLKSRILSTADLQTMITEPRSGQTGRTKEN